MTREEILKNFNINSIGVITDPGKFEGEMIYAPYFYDLSCAGCSDEITCGDIGGPTDHFDITEEDIDLFPELEGINRLALYEDEAGCVYCYAEEE